MLAVLQLCLLIDMLLSHQDEDSMLVSCSESVSEFSCSCSPSRPGQLHLPRGLPSNTSSWFAGMLNGDKPACFC
jgi:hypothetical protein